MKKFVLENDFQRLTFLDVGATIYSWEIKTKSHRNIVLSNHNLADYQNSACGYLGATIGRVTNRIKDGRFTLDGIDYQLSKNFDGKVNAGHGGPHGFWWQTFIAKTIEKDQIVFAHLSPDGEEGYPGEFRLEVTYKLEGDKLIIEYDAVSNKKTIANITNHSYFNLAGSHSVLDHQLTLEGPYFLPFDNQKAVSGEKRSVKGTALDFSKTTRLGDIIEDPYLQDPKTNGLDHCLYFGDNQSLRLEVDDLALTISTSYPCVQLYGTGFPGPQELVNGKRVKKYQALAIEPQLAVDAINFPHLGQITLEKGEKYHHFIIYHLEEK